MTCVPPTPDWAARFSSAIQAGCAVVVAVLTYFLVRFTRRYVSTTERALALANEQLNEQRESLGLLRRQIEHQEQALRLTREQFEREWEPDVRVADINQVGNDLAVRVINLGRPAVLIEDLHLRIAENADSGPEDRFPVQRIVPGEGFIDIPVGWMVSQYPQRHLQAHYVPNVGFNLHGVMGFAVTYLGSRAASQGAPQHSAWREFRVQFVRGSINSIELL